jgi:hypothetical protein
MKAIGTNAIASDTNAIADNNFAKARGNIR